VDEGEVGAGELVVADGKAAVLFEAANQPLDDVALVAGAPINEAQLGLGRELRDDRRHAAAPEALADRTAGVAAVGEQGLGSRAWPTRAGALGGSAPHQRQEGGLLMALTDGEGEGDRSPATLAAQLELAAERLAFLPPLASAV
jgi:hypothetical protein